MPPLRTGPVKKPAKIGEVDHADVLVLEDIEPIKQLTYGDDDDEEALDDEGEPDVCRLGENENESSLLSEDGVRGDDYGEATDIEVSGSSSKEVMRPVAVMVVVVVLVVIIVVVE